MPRDSNGTYTLPAGNPVVTNTTISSTWANTTLDDIGTALTNSLDRAGSGGMTGQLKLANGLVGAPGLTWGTEPTSGLYRAGAGDFRYSIASNDILTLTAALVTVVPPVSFTAASRFADGAVATPSISFTADTDLGFYRAAANDMRAAAASADIASFTTSGIRLIAGSVGSPSLSLISDTNTGIYSGGADTLAVSAGGVFAGGWAAGQYISPDGTVSAPAYSFNADTNTGMYRQAADTIRFTAGGADVLSLTTTAVAALQPFWVSDGSVGSPGFAFSSDSNTGIYRIGADDIGFSTGGVLRAEINSSGVFLYGGFEVGLRNAERTSASGNVTLTSASRGRMHQYTGGGGNTWTITTNSGTDGAFYFIQANASLTLTPSSGTLYWFNGSGTLATGNRTLAGGGVCTIQVNSVAGDAYVWGVGLS